MKRRSGSAGAAVRRLAAALDRRVAGLRTRTVQVGPHRITYDEARRGSGPTIVALHGFTADRQVWTRFAARLKGYHVVVPDLLGHGATPFAAGAGYSASDQAKRLAQFLDTIGVEKAHVIGNSMGGLITATLAASYPARLLSAGLVDSAGLTSPVPSTVDRIVGSGARNPFLLEDVAQFEEFYPLTMAKPPFVPGFVRRSIAADYFERRAEYTEIFDGFSAPSELEDLLHTITAPAWVAWGEQDELVDVSAARVWADGIPNARLVTYPDLGHMPMFEAPRRCAKDYLAFLDAIEGR